jgi:hypothetical protein
MKSILHTDGCPEIVLSKGELDKLRNHWAILEELSYRGRNGAMIGTTPYTGDQLMVMAEDLRALLIAVDNGKSIQKQDGILPDLLAQEEP